MEIGKFLVIVPVVHLLFMRVEQLTIRTSFLLFQVFGVKELHQTQITFILMILRLMATLLLITTHHKFLIPL